MGDDDAEQVVADDGLTEELDAGGAVAGRCIGGWADEVGLDVAELRDGVGEGKFLRERTDERGVGIGIVAAGLVVEVDDVR